MSTWSNLGDDLLEIVATLVSTAVNPNELNLDCRSTCSASPGSARHLGSQHRPIRTWPRCSSAGFAVEPGLISIVDPVNNFAGDR